MPSPRHFVRTFGMCALMLGVTALAFGEPPGTASPAKEGSLASEAKPAATPPSRHPEPMPPQVVSHRANLDTIAAYRGEKSPAILVALISREVSPIIRQEPAVALSDGKTALRILAYLGLGDGSSPNFALNGATLISLNRSPAPDSNWIIQALPQPNVTRASLTILTNSEMIDYPLTLAPPVAGISALEADFKAFLKDSGSSPPKRDLNGDGRHDYLDDFIYTANYLALRSGDSAKKK
ncbi:MAG: hypothetical protein HXX11_21350 [Desulfuromonadales bacterium]|nr:hypothetical protein [Desulfuromonadales bacterium]